MKKMFLKFFFIFSGFLHGIYGLSQNPGNDLLGVWKYEVEGMEGICIFTPGHCAWVYLRNDRPNLNGKTLGQQDKVSAYNGITDVGILTWKSDGKRATTSWMGSTWPDNVSKTGSFSWDYEIKGDQWQFWIIEPDGKRGFAGKARRLASWNDKSPTSHLNGVWTYQNIYQGKYVHCADYGIWLITGDPGFKTGTDEEKAKAFDSVNGAAVACRLGNGREYWHVLHATDPRREKQVYITQSEMKDGNEYSFWFVDGDGNKIGDKVHFKKTLE